MMITDAPSCPLLRLPRELRYEIYDHLSCRDFKSYPFRKLPISSIDQTGPPTALLVTCRYLCDEIRTYLIARVTLGFVAQSTPLRYQDIDPVALAVIQEARKIDTRIDWQRVPRAGIDTTHWPYQVNGWLADLVALLLDKAKSLELITLSFVELGRGTDWEQKERTLTPLKKIARRVRFRLGDVITEDEKEAELREWLGIYLKELNEVVLPAVGS